MAGQAISRRLSRGDDSSDEFTVAAILGGKQFRSRSPGTSAQDQR